MGTESATLRPLTAWLSEPVDPAGLVLLRSGFGVLAVLAASRFVAKGWVEDLLLAPAVHFPWVSWAAVPPSPVLYGLFALQALAGLAIAAGWQVRPALVLWLVSFGYVELLDKALYLNHYVLFTLLGLVLFVAPTGQLRLSGGPALARGWPVLLQVLVGSVYVWAGLVKLNPDWLWRAEPLHTWLAARAGIPVFGPWLAHKSTAYAMSWGGAAYDLTVPFLLLLPRTRVVGMVLVTAFHAIVGLLFPIGLFPWLMVVAATVFLPPDWPRRWFPGSALTQAVPPFRPLGTMAWCLAVLAIVAIPARGWLLGPDIAWTERGYRFSWRVLLNEKTGLVDFRVVEPATGRVWRALPAEVLTPLQHKQMRTQPDLIRDHALYLKRMHLREGRIVAVYADAFASLNGRGSQRLIRPDVDLTQPLASLTTQGWIVPLQQR